MLEIKTFWTFRVLGCLFKAGMEECDQKVWNVLDQFDITIRFSATSFLEVGAPISFKVATKGSLKGKNTLKS